MARPLGSHILHWPVATWAGSGGGGECEKGAAVRPSCSSNASWFDLTQEESSGPLSTMLFLSNSPSPKFSLRAKLIDRPDPVSYFFPSIWPGLSAAGAVAWAAMDAPSDDCAPNLAFHRSKSRAFPKVHVRFTFGGNNFNRQTSSSACVVNLDQDPLC